MNIEDFLKAIQPNLTVLAALFGSFLLFIKLYWNIYKLEDKIRSENINKIAALANNFQKNQIEPIISSLCTSTKLNGFLYALELAKQTIINEEFDSEAGDYKVSLNQDDEVLSFFEQANLRESKKEAKDQFSKESAEFLYTAEGTSFLRHLGILYDTKCQINKNYSKIIYYCRVTWFICLFLAIISLVGMLVYSASFSLYIEYSVLNLGMFLLLTGVFSFIAFNYRLNKLKDEWETIKIHGNEQEEV